jgi:hypothetical protein
VCGGIALNFTRAYMITVPADREYLVLTGHDRMPKLHRNSKHQAPNSK